MKLYTEERDFCPKVKIGINTNLILGIIFSVLGLGMIILGVVVYSFSKPEQTEDAEILLLIPGGIGLAFLVPGLIAFLGVVLKIWRQEKAVAGGQYIMGYVVNVTTDAATHVNDRFLQRLECHYSDPDTGIMHIFLSNPVTYYPQEKMNTEVKIYVCPRDLRCYYVDINQPVSYHK
ncbi:MAG: hypothetical protein LKF52_10235 [Butyrivibrio sp.]|jgi:uncharacterized membrane protein|nr:hypothetical protein [Butyrivibrio sp.]